MQRRNALHAQLLPHLVERNPGARAEVVALDDDVLRALFVHVYSVGDVALLAVVFFFQHTNSEHLRFLPASIPVRVNNHQFRRIIDARQNLPHVVPQSAA